MTYNSAAIKNSHTVVMVCLYAEFPGYLTTVRKFFESYNCRVVINSFTDHYPHYRIVFGNPKFVKVIHDRLKKYPVKTAYICISAAPADPPFPLAAEDKFIRIDQVKLTDTDTAAIMNFFFLGSARQMHLVRSPGADENRQGKHYQKNNQTKLTEDIIPDLQQVTTREPVGHGQSPTSDSEKRIRNLIREIYKPATKPSTGKKRMSPVRLLFLIGIISGCISAFALLPFFCTGLSILFFKNLHFTPVPLLTGTSSFLIRSETLLLGPCQLIARQPCSDYSRLLALLQRTNETLEAGLTLKGLMEQAKKTTSPDGLIAPQSPAVIMDNFRTHLPGLRDSLSVIDGELAYFTGRTGFPSGLPVVRNVLAAALSEVRATKAQLENASDLLTVYAESAGFDRRRTFLVLLQNKNELRATGGFIGSTAVVQMEGGNVADLRILDVYDLDGQLKGHVDPPAPLRNLLGSEHWYLRDSNWDPDFRTSGKMADWFYESITGESLDGVIAVNSGMLTDVLLLTGPVYLPDFNLTVSADTVHDQIHDLVDGQFFPGSNQKKNLLGSLFAALVSELKSPDTSPVPLLSLLLGQLDTGSVMLYFDNRALTALSAIRGWDGAFPGEGTSCASAAPGTCLTNVIGLVDSNLSANKSDAYIDRRIDYRIRQTEEGSVRGESTLTYTNTADATETGGLNYRNYHRSYLPGATGEISVFLDGIPVPVIGEEEATSSALPYAQMENHGGYSVVGVAFIVPETETRKLTVAGTILEATASGMLSAIDTVLSIQSGLRDVPVTISLIPAGGRYFEISGNNPGFVANGVGLEYNTSVSGRFGVTALVRKKEQP